MQRCFQSKSYDISVKLRQGFALGLEWYELLQFKTAVIRTPLIPRSHVRCNHAGHGTARLICLSERWSTVLYRAVPGTVIKTVCTVRHGTERHSTVNVNTTMPLNRPEHAQLHKSRPQHVYLHANVELRALW